MQCLAPFTAPIATIFGPTSLSVSDGALTPEVAAGTVVWSTIANKMMFYNGSNWSSGVFPTSIYEGAFFDVSANTNETAGALTLEGTLFIEGTVVFT